MLELVLSAYNFFKTMTSFKDNVNANHEVHFVEKYSIEQQLGYCYYYH